MSINSKIAKLEKKSYEQGQYQVAAAASHLQSDIGDINRQINLVGALHEVGQLKNVLSSYWTEFRTDEPAWINCCLDRLVSSDHDYWALAALLGCNGLRAIDAALEKGFKTLTTRSYERYGKPSVKVSTLYLNANESVLHPILEIGYDESENTVTDIGRARALSVSDEKWELGQIVGTGDLSLSMQAKLPHGAWRTVNTKFE